jgi:hypothetical protein
MPNVASGNAIDFGSSINKQGVLLGPLEYINIMGYVDIPSTGTSGPLPWIVEEPSRVRADTSSIILPNPNRLTAVGISIPSTNRAGQTANLVGTNTATFRNGNASGDTAGAIVTFSGTTQGAINTIVATPFPASDANARTYQFFTSASVASSRGTMRIFGWVQYAVVRPFPNVEFAVQIDAPVYNQ